MKKVAVMLAGGMVSAAMVAGPAQASGSSDQVDPNVCGDAYVFAGATKIQGPSGRESLGQIVQMTDLTTHDACAYVRLKKDTGTTGTLTLTVSTAGVDTPEGTWDTTTPSDTAIDLATRYVSAPVFLTYPDVDRASVSVAITGSAFQGKQHSEHRVRHVDATKAEERAARKAFRDSVKAARKALKKHGNEARYERAVDRARKHRDDVLDGHSKHVTVVVGDTTPFDTTATREFVLATAVEAVDAG